MRNFQTITALFFLGSAFLGSGAQAAGSAVKQCTTYANTCKHDASIKALPRASKLAAIDKCIMDAASADGATGAACVKEQSGRKHQ